MSYSRKLSGCQIFDPVKMPEDWSCLPLKERLELLYGRALKEETRTPGDIDVFGSNGKVGTHNVPWLDGPGVLIGRKGTVGAVTYAHRQFWPIDTVYYVNPSSDDDLRYLYYLLDYLPLKLLNAATGVPGLSRRDAYALRGAFPPPDEQAAIARVLDAVDVAIERARDSIEGATKVKNALVQDFFYAALGVTAYADRPTKDLPPGWALLPMDALISEEPKNGVSPKASSQPPGTPTFSIAAIRDGRVDLSNTDNLKYTEISAKVAEKFKISRGDILIVRGNANPDLVGKAGRVTDFPDGCIYPDITKRVVLRDDGDHRLLPEFAVFAWNHAIVHNQILRRAKTSNGTLKINSRDVKQVVMPAPPLKEQEKIVGLTMAVDAKIDALNAKLAALQQLKQSLLHDLLTGTVRVGDGCLAAAPSH